MLWDKLPIQKVNPNQSYSFGCWEKTEEGLCFYVKNGDMVKYLYFHEERPLKIVVNEGVHVNIFDTSNCSHYELLPHASVLHISKIATRQLHFALSESASLKHYSGESCDEPKTESHVCIHLNEMQASVVWNEGLILKDTEQHASTICIEHKAPNTHSDCSVNSIIRDSGLFQLKCDIYVRSEAENSVTHQRNLNHILSPQGRVVARPQLHIFNRKIEASHGSATQPVSPEILFYLQARGLSYEQALQLYLDSFLNKLKGSVLPPDYE